MRKIVCCLIMLAVSFFGQTNAQDTESQAPPAKTPTAAALTITSAVYGDLESKKTKDVTELLVPRVKDGGLRFEVNNDVLGDPAEGSAKTLHVKFILNGTAHDVKTEEGDTVLIPVPKLKGKLVITKAVYGDLLNDEVYDVTKLVQRMVKDNSLEVDVNNDWFGDPASGTMKRMRVEYKIGDVTLTKTRWEESKLKIFIPEPKVDDARSPATETDAAKS